MLLSAFKNRLFYLFGKKRGNLAALLLIFFLLLTLGLAANQVQKRQLLEKKAAGENSSLTLPENLTVNLGEQFTVPVYLDTDNVEIGGVDVILDFSADMDKISLVGIQPDAQGGAFLKTFIPVDASGNFDALMVVNKANLTGKVEFGAVTYDSSTGQPTNPFNGILGVANPLATLTFQVDPGVASPTQATITVVHTPGITTDSNLVALDSVADVLAQANSLTVSISAQPLPLFQGWNEIVWPEASGIKASDIPDACPIAVSKESAWFKPYVRDYGGVNFDFESNKTYYLYCTQDYPW